MMGISRGGAIALAAAIFFSTKAIFVKLAYAHGTDAITLLTLRMLFALPLLIAIGLYSSCGRLAPLTPHQWGRILFLGIIGYYLSSLFDFLGLFYISAGLERLILFLYPTIIVLLSTLFLGKKINRTEAISLLLSYGGIAIAFIHDIEDKGDINAVLIGGSFVFIATITYAIYMVGSGQLVASIGAMRLGAYATSIAALCCLIQFLLTHPLSDLNASRPVLEYGLIMAVVSTVLPILLTAKAIQMIGAMRVSMIGTIGPVATVFLALIFLKEPVGWPQIAGAGLVMAGIVPLTRKEKIPKREEAKAKTHRASA